MNHENPIDEGPLMDAHIILREIQSIVKLDDKDFAVVADVMSVALHVLENRLNQKVAA
jgi:hypothetical protein